MGYKEEALKAVKEMADIDGYRDGDNISRRAVISILSMIGSEPEGKWIWVRERLPEPYKEVLVCYEFMYDSTKFRICRTGHVCNDGAWDGEGSLARLYAVAWMPLPLVPD